MKAYETLVNIDKHRALEHWNGGMQVTYCSSITDERQKY